jgi:hypothetical protein
VAAIISYNLDGREHLTDPKKKAAAKPVAKPVANRSASTENIHKLANKLLAFLEGAPSPQVAVKKLTASRSKSPIKPRSRSRSPSKRRSRSRSPTPCKPRYPRDANLTLPGPNTGCTKCCGKSCGAKHLQPAPFIKKSSIVPCTCTKFSMSCGRHAGGRNASRVPGYMGDGDGSELRDVPGFLNSFDAFSH